MMKNMNLMLLALVAMIGFALTGCGGLLLPYASDDDASDDDATDDDDDASDDDATDDDDDAATDDDEEADGASSTNCPGGDVVEFNGTEVAMCAADVYPTVDPSDLPDIEVCMAGYGFGGDTDWTCESAREMVYTDGYLTIDLADFGYGLYRINSRSMTDSSLWAALGCSGDGLGSSNACYSNSEEQGYGFSLCLDVRPTIIMVGDFLACEELT